MSTRCHGIAVGFFAVLAAAGFVGIAPAAASKPVPKTIVGCVANGSFVSTDGYEIGPRTADGQAIDLRPFEGRQVTISGDLLPGDAFIVKKPPADSGPCRTGKPAGADPAVAPAAQAVKVTTGGWQIHRPSKEYQDLPALLPKQQDSLVEAGIGLLEFVCMKSNYYVLLVQPSVKLRDTEPGMIAPRAANTASGSAPAPLTFRNLYKTKSLLSRSLNWDADIHYAELGAPLLGAIKAASNLDLTLAGRSYAINLSDLASRWGSFQRFCEGGVVGNPAHFEQ
ncbi:hypothetical protein [Bradyrhizobium sp. SZCCHNPS1003]|uniref:hypothetical protein n=1 Tax=Bradyrhizobium sp. SZCCHNPS1003 TaxID=3057330 RepID=UPI0028E89F56|nr:hypothetical protein [Bradyrhizobium sp. SZCCHNPS1003]